MKARKRTYRSGLEDKIVPGALARGATYEPVSLTFQGAPRRYKPDLVLPNAIVVEIKGWFTPADRAKTEAVLKANPGLELRFVFDNPRAKLNRTSRTTYAEWCDARRIAWAAKDVPASWYAEDEFLFSRDILDAAQPVKKSVRRVA